MARKIKNLSVKTREYKDRDGNSKANYQNVGAIMENDNGKQFMLIDKFINFAGLPDFSGKENSGCSNDFLYFSDIEKKEISGQSCPHSPAIKRTKNSSKHKPFYCVFKAFFTKKKAKIALKVPIAEGGVARAPALDDLLAGFCQVAISHSLYSGYCNQRFFRSSE